MKPILILVLVGALLLGYLVVISSLQQAGPPEEVTAAAPAQGELPQIPGITAPDEEPNGCVSCHRLREDIGQDFRLSTQIEEWSSEGAPEWLLMVAQRAAPEGVTLTGYHPKVAAQARTETIPDLCLGCHGEDSTYAPPFARLLHLIKFAQPEDLAENHFITSYRGQCTYCHTLNKDTGVMSVKSGKEGE